MRNALMFVAASGLCAGASMAATIHVDDDAPSDPGPGTPAVSDPLEDGSAAHPFDSIQEAIDASVDGDVIQIAAGLYTGVGNRAMNPGGRAISIVGASVDTVIVDLEGTSAGFIFDTGERSATQLEHLTVRNGSSSAGGAAVWCANGSSPTISHCDFRSHTADGQYGAVMRVGAGSTLTLTSCRFIDNLVDATFSFDRVRGVAIHAANSELSLIDCEFRLNIGASFDDAEGGAIWIDGGTLDVDGCVFDGNGIYGDIDTSQGGAIFSDGAAVTVTDSVFIDNEAAVGELVEGGAVYVEHAVATFTSSSFTMCRAEGDCLTRGGAVAADESGSSFVDCTFSANEAVGFGNCGGSGTASAGAVHAIDSGFLRCTFVGNRAVAVSRFSAGSAGAATMSNQFEQCLFRQNEANSGGALGVFAVSGSDAEIRNCVFDGNRALGNHVFPDNLSPGRGGAIRIPDGIGVRIVNCTFTANVAEMNGLTLDPGEGGAVYAFDDTEIIGSILTANEPDQSFGAAVVSFSNIEGGHPGFGNIDAAPGFVDAVAGDFRLAAGSPCIDAANGLIDLGAFDVAGEARRVDDPGTVDSGIGPAPLPDMGAYEYQGPSCVADLDDSGDVGFNDLVAVLAAWGPCAGCAADLNDDDAVTFDDLLVVLGAWGPCS